MKATHRPSILPSRLVPLLAVLVLAAACGGSASAPMQSNLGMAFDGAATAAPSSGSALAAGASTAGGPATTSQVLDAARANLLIIKTGTMALQVKENHPSANVTPASYSNMKWLISKNA